MNFRIKKSEINPQLAKSYRLDGKDIVICNLGGKYYATSNICSHAMAELVSNEILIQQDCFLECPRHGAKFDIKTGEAKKMPAVTPIETYKVIENIDELEIIFDKEKEEVK